MNYDFKIGEFNIYIDMELIALTNKFVMIGFRYEKIAQISNIKTVKIVNLVSGSGL
jgi:hypothetical protein